eukprot:761556-Hanusia_phi.AAC.5
MPTPCIKPPLQEPMYWLPLGHVARPIPWGSPCEDSPLYTIPSFSLIAQRSWRSLGSRRVF